MMPFKLALSMTVTMVLIFGLMAGFLSVVLWYFNLGMVFAVLFGIIMLLVQWAFSPKIIEWITNMRYLEKDEYPWLWNMVKDISRKLKVPVPKLAIARSGAPNAFTFGRTQKDARVVVTTGLLKTLSKDEVGAVIGHELTHIRNRDVIVLTVVSILPIIAYYVAQVLTFQRRDERDKGGLGILLGIGAFFIYFVSNLLILALSRLREYAADYGGATATKPSLLASGLAKITYGLSISPERHQNSAVRSFYIADPVSAVSEVSRFSSEYADLRISESELQKAMEWEKKNPLMKFLEIWQTHPLTFKRIQALEKLGREMKV